MTRFNFNSVSKSASTRESLAWDKSASALIFAALLIACSLSVGCSSDKPKTTSSNNQIPVTQNPPSMASSTTPPLALQTEAKPAPKKVVHKRPATVTYNDKSSGVSFDYPRKYAIETGDAANDLVTSSSVPMNFVQPGGVALAAVELPETSFPDTDLSYAFFNVSVNKSVNADQCQEFSVPQTTPTAPPDPAAKTASTETASAQHSKLMLGDLELQGTETVSGEGTRQSDVKYFHAFQNGACYEFALNVTTVANQTAGELKHVDRDKVFNRLEKILATVKINAVPAAAPEVTASAPTMPQAPAAPETPAQ